MATANKKSIPHVMDMTQGNPAKLMLTFAIPLFIGNIFQQIYSMVDTMVAGYTLGDSAIAAIGATSALSSLIVNFAIGLNSGCAIVVTQRFGAHDEPRLRASIAGMMELDAVITGVLTVLSLVFLRPLMHFMNTPETIMEHAYGYIAVLCAGMLATIAYNMFSGILRALGNSRTSLFFLIIASVLNIGLDVLFVSVLGMGVAGAALATVIAQAVSAALCGIYVFRHYRQYWPRRRDFQVSPALLRELVANGLAMALMHCVVDLGSVIFQRANNQLGEAFISAHTAARRIIGIMSQPLSTLSMAASTFIGQNWGAQKLKRIRVALRQALVMEIIWSLVAWILIFILGNFLVQLTTGTSDPQIISNAVMSLRWHLSFFPALGCLFVLRNSMQSMGRPIIPILSSCIELCMKILSAAIAVPSLGFLGTCITEPFTWLVMFLFLGAGYLVLRKKLLPIEA